MKYKYSFDSIPWEETSIGAKQKVQTVDNQKIRLLYLEYGFAEKKSCTKSHKAYVLKGELQIDFDGDLQYFKEGDGFIIPAGEEHKHKVLINEGQFAEILVLE